MTRRLDSSFEISTDPSVDSEQPRSERALATKKEYLVPCTYHFYQRPPVLVRGQGAYLFDSDGKQYLDCFAGVTVMNAGHSNPAIIEPAIDQLRQLQHTTSIYLTEPVLELARTIAEIAPADLRQSFFCASGSEANEGALMLAALATGRKKVISLDGALHGRTKAAMNTNGLEMWRTDPFPLADFLRVPGPNNAESLDRLQQELRSEDIAAVIAEPIQGNGGIIVPQDGYWARLRELCTQYGTLLIADEIQTAWNRTGKWFATEHWGVVPDIITVAKALGNGFPIAAYITTNKLAAHYSRPGAATFGGNLVSCRAALATIRFHRENRLGARSQALGLNLFNRLQELAMKYPNSIAEVRGMGLMLGIELRCSTGNNIGVLTDSVLEMMKDQGYLLGKCGPERNVLACLPPLVIEESELDRMVENLDRTLARLM